MLVIQAMERKKELQKHRALMSAYEQKCKRMRRIKSKRCVYLLVHSFTHSFIHSFHHLPFIIWSFLQLQISQSSTQIYGEDLRQARMHGWRFNEVTGESKSQKIQDYFSHPLNYNCCLFYHRRGWLWSTAVKPSGRKSNIPGSTGTLGWVVSEGVGWVGWVGEGVERGGVGEGVEWVGVGEGIGWVGEGVEWWAWARESNNGWGDKRKILVLWS